MRKPATVRHAITPLIACTVCRVRGGNAYRLTVELSERTKEKISDKWLKRINVPNDGKKEN